MIKVLPSKTAEEVVARERERKARTTLLMALPEDHLAKFHKMADAKEMYDRFQTLLSKLKIHGAGISHEDANQKFLRSIPSSLSQVALIMRIKSGLDTLSFDDLYNNLRINNDDMEEMDLKWQDDSKALVTIDEKDIDWSGHVEEDAQNYAMMAYSSSNSGSDNEVKSCSKTCKESYARLKKLYDKQRDKLGDASVEITAYTLALKKVKAQLLCHQKNQLAYEQKIRFTKIDLDDKTDVLAYHKKLLAEALKEKEDLKTKFENWQNSSKNLSRLLNTQMSANDKFRLGYGDYRYGSILKTTTSMHEPVENAPKVVCEPKVWTDAPIIEEENVKETGTPNHSPKIGKKVRNSHTRKGLGYAFTRKSCFVCGSFSHLIRYCDFHEKRMAKQAELTKSKNKDDLHRALKDKGIVDSGCSRHMTGNKAHLALISCAG
nr:xylulose kinase-1 [Tanacetum cinerariifolium]